MPGRRDKTLLATEKETLFVANFKGNQTAAARAAGYKDPKQAGSDLMKRPRIMKAIAEKQSALAKESGKQLARAATISRTEVLQIAATVARANNSPPQAKIAAAALLAKILGMIVTKTEDVTAKYAGWTEEEMEHYAVTGEYPERIRSLHGDGEASSVPKGAAEAPAE